MYRKIIEFEKITKFPLILLLEKYAYFNENYLAGLKLYFSGRADDVDVNAIDAMNELKGNCAELLSIINSYNNKLSDCGFWELIDYLESLNDNIEKIIKLPKYYHVTKTISGYRPIVESNGNVGGMRTFEDVENELRYDNFDTQTTWGQIMLNNDIEETAWEIDELKQVKYTISAPESIKVSTILDILQGDNIYGRDISRKITFDDNDLFLVKYADNIKQKCEILLNLKKGDVPEMPLFGVDNKFLGEGVKAFSYNEVFTQIEGNFLQNDIFDSVEIYDVKFDNGSISISIDIKTKYDYSLVKKLDI